MKILRRLGEGLRRAGYLTRAAAWAMVLGVIEMVGSERGRRLLALFVLGVGTVGMWLMHPIRTVAPDEVGVRVNRWTGGLSQLHEGWALVLPGVHELHRYPLRDQFYRPAASAHADGSAPFQSIEGLSIGVDVAVRYALDPACVASASSRLPDDVGTKIVEPVVDGILHRTFASHTVREIFSTRRAEIQQSIENELRPLLAKDGVVMKTVFLGNVDLPAEYKSGIQALLSEELSAEKMRYTLELKEKQVKQTALEADADKIKRERAAEAAGQEEIIAARAKAEAMKHVLPFKEKEIEQRRLEAEASKVQRLKQAEAEAGARRIEASGEADSRRKLAEADAYRMEITGKASSEQMARESALIAKNPLLIQKTLADKLSDKIQVIIAPPHSGGFFAGNLVGTKSAHDESSHGAQGEGEE